MTGRVSGNEGRKSIAFTHRCVFNPGRKACRLSSMLWSAHNLWWQVEPAESNSAADAYSSFQRGHDEAMMAKNQLALDIKMRPKAAWC